MNAFKLLMAASCFLGLATSGVAKQDYSKSEGLLQYVDPYIGSGFHGHVFVGTSVPYGMVQLGPNNIHKGWDWCSGYHYSDSILIGFSHTHLSGTGCTDLGDILIMPLNEIRTPRGNQDDIRAEEVISRLKGIKCGFKNTSCPDQLSTALEEVLNK